MNLSLYSILVYKPLKVFAQLDLGRAWLGHRLMISEWSWGRVLISYANHNLRF